MDWYVNNNVKGQRWQKTSVAPKPFRAEDEGHREKYLFISSKEKFQIIGYPSTYPAFSAATIDMCCWGSSVSSSVR